MFNGKELSLIINVKNDCSSFETAKKYFNLYLFVFLDCFDANSRLCPKSNEINYWYSISCLGLMLYYWAFGRTGSKVERFTQNIQLWRSNLSSQHRSVVIQFGFFEILASYVAIWAFYEKICFPTRISSWISFNYGCQGKLGLYFCLEVQDETSFVFRFPIILKANLMNKFFHVQVLIRSYKN